MFMTFLVKNLLTNLIANNRPFKQYQRAKPIRIFLLEKLVNDYVNSYIDSFQILRYYKNKL